MGASGSLELTTTNCVDSWQAGEWHHLVAVYDGSTGTISCDGSQKAQGPITPVQPNDQPFVIGNNAALDVGWGDGIIDEVRIYDRIVTETEVSELFNMSQ